MSNLTDVFADATERRLRTRINELEAAALGVYEANTQMGYNNMWPAIAKLFEVIGKRAPTPASGGTGA